MYTDLQDAKYDTAIKEHVQGRYEAPVELVEYADYQCPYCRNAYFQIKEIQKELGKNLKFIFRNFPLTDIHPYALKAAIAAETAGLQEKFWEMHDMIFENQQYLEEEDLFDYAKQIGVDIKQFREDFGTDKLYNKINEDYHTGLLNHVEGTPCFLVNGHLFEGDWTGNDFIDYLKEVARENK